MTRDEYADAIARDAAGFADAAAAADLVATVRACPDWTVADLVWHLTEVHHFWRTIAAERLDDPEKVERVDRPADGDLVDAFRDGAAKLVEVLRPADPHTVVWTWAAQKNIGFIQRHQAQETAVHRWDAEQAAGREFAIEPALASDSIDEWLEFSAPFARKDAPPLGGTVHIHCTDVDGEWFVESGGDGALAVTREHKKGDVALRGSASDLLLALYRRVPLDTIDVIGDRGVADRFVARTALD